MKSKECFKCGEIKRLSEFYKHPQMADGHVNKCKNCNKMDVRQNRKDKIEYYREYDKGRGNSRQAEYRRSYRLSYRSRFPNKIRAHSKINDAISDGRLKRGIRCEICSSKKTIHGHHDDYSKPFDVRWLCAVCHKAWHLVNGDGKNP